MALPGGSFGKYTPFRFSAKRIEMFKHIRSEEVGSTLRETQLQSQRGGLAVELSKLLYNFSGNVMTRTLFSKRAFGSSQEHPEFRETIVEMSALSGAVLIGNFIPSLHWLDPQGYKKRMDFAFKRMDSFLDQVVSERLRKRQKISAEYVPKDFLDVLIDIYKGGLEAVGTDHAIKCALLELLSVSAETSSTAIEWAMSELLRNPRVLKKLQQEPDNVVGGKTQVEESDIPKLEYLEAVLKETFRLHPPLPLLLHQMSRPSGEVAGYYIPENTMIVVNLWAIGRDPLVWEDAGEFMPERFMGSCSNIDVRGHHYELLPFGSGRRGCPGINLGLLTVGFVISNLVYSFDWRLPEGESRETLDMTENAGLTTPKAKPLLAVPKARRLLPEIKTMAASRSL